MKRSHLELLLEIAARKGIFSNISVTTMQLAHAIHTSQQTVSRQLRELERLGILQCISSPMGSKVMVTKKGIQELQSTREKLNEIFTPKKKSLIGIVTSSQGEGKYYLSIPQYRNQIKKQLGFAPYPGTLNIVCNPSDVAAFLFPQSPIHILGFTTKQRTFGGINCYPVVVGGIRGAIVVPERTRHGREVAEIIAPVNLKRKLRINDGSRVRLIA